MHEKIYPDHFLPPIDAVILALRKSGYGVKEIGEETQPDESIAWRWNVVTHAGVDFCALYLHASDTTTITQTNVIYEVSTDERTKKAGSFANLHPDTPDLLVRQLLSALSSLSKESHDKL